MKDIKITKMDASRELRVLAGKYADFVELERNGLNETEWAIAHKGYIDGYTAARTAMKKELDEALSMLRTVLDIIKKSFR